MKLASAQPASLEAIPKQDRIHLPGEFMDPPYAVALDDLAGRIQRQAVQTAESIDLILVFADVAVLKSDVVGAISAPARSAASGIEALALHPSPRPLKISSGAAVEACAIRSIGTWIIIPVIGRWSICSAKSAHSTAPELG